MKLFKYLFLFFFLVLTLNATAQKVKLRDLERADTVDMIPTTMSNGKQYYIHKDSFLKDVQGNIYVENVATLLTTTATNGDILITKGFAAALDGGGAIYYVQADSITGFPIDTVMVVPLSGSNYAILQPTPIGYFIENWGAFGNDAVFDDVKGQQAIDAIITVQSTTAQNINLKTSEVLNFKNGVFYLNKGLVISKDLNDDGTYEFVTFKLQGALSPYSSSSSSLGDQTVLELRDTGSFCIAVQQGRKVKIRNLVLTANTSNPPFTLNRSDYLYFDDTFFDTLCRININSPFAGIVIDPFYSAVPSADRYQLHDSYYTGPSSSGTSMADIEDCAIYGLHDAIAIKPFALNVNGDNITATNIATANCRNFWTSRSTQSRANSINNVYSLGAQTFIKNYGAGTPPTVNNLNLAGFTKHIYNVSTGFGAIRAENIYAESLWSIGIADADNITFVNCQFKFDNDTELPAPNYHLKTSGVANFIGGNIQYFTNCLIKPPMLFEAKKVNLNGTFIEGGVIFTGAISSQDEQHVNYDGANYSCPPHSSPNTILGNRFGLETTIRNSVWVSGDKIHDNSGNGTGSVTTNTGNVILLLFQENATVTIDTIVDDIIGRFTSTNAANYNVGDGLMTIRFITSPNQGGASVQAPLGYISSIDNDTVFVGKITDGFPSGNSESVYVMTLDSYVLPAWGNTVSGQDSVTSIVSGLPLIKQRIQVEGFTTKARVVEVGSDWIRMSEDATSTNTRTQLKSISPYKQEFWLDDPSDISTGKAVSEGAIIWNTNPASDSISHWVCIKGGLDNTAPDEPIFEAISSVGGGGVSDHGALTGLSDDDHPNNAYLPGRSGGQTLIGGTGTTDDLNIQSTSGVGATGANINFLVGNNGADTAMVILNSGAVLIGVDTAVDAGTLFHIKDGLINTFEARTLSNNPRIAIRNSGNVGLVLSGFGNGPVIGSHASIGLSRFASDPFVANPTNPTLHADLINIRVGIATVVPTAKLDVNSDIIRLRTAKTPSSASDTGNSGDIAWDATYFYICVATDTWQRVLHATW